MNNPLIRLLLISLLVLPLSGASAAGRVDDDIFVSYIYAAVMDSGTYTINGRRITMLRIPFSWTLREPDAQNAGWKVLLPVVVGYDDLSSIDSPKIEDLLPDNLASLTVLPGNRVRLSAT